MTCIYLYSSYRTAELQQELNDIMYSLEASIYFQLIIDLVSYELASNNIIVFVICTHESLVPCLQIQIDIRRLDLACKKCIGNCWITIERIITPTVEHNTAYRGNTSRQMNIDDDVWKHYGNIMITNDNTALCLRIN